MMISNALDLKIESLQRELSANAKEMIRLQRVMETETRELMQAQAERDGESGFNIQLMNLETQAVLSYHGGKLHD
jgi:hypothetical protein